MTDEAYPDIHQEQGPEQTMLHSPQPGAWLRSESGTWAFQSSGQSSELAAIDPDVEVIHMGVDWKRLAREKREVANIRGVQPTTAPIDTDTLPVKSAGTWFMVTDHSDALPYAGDAPASFWSWVPDSSRLHAVSEVRRDMPA